VRIWGRVALGGIAVLTSSFVITIPAGTAGAAPSHPGGVTDTCPEVLAGAPTGGMEKVTEPADGSEVRRGEVVSVTLRWDTTTFTSPVLHKALDCVTVDGTPADELSTQERDTANDGAFEYDFTVPGDLPDGARLCDRGFVSGPGDNGFDREKSNDVCFVVRGDTPAEAPAPAAAPTSSETPASPDSQESPAPTATPDAATPDALPVPDVAPVPVRGPVPANSVAAPVAETPSPAPIGAGPAGNGAPGTEVSPDVAVSGEQDVLPRTGSAVEGPLRLGMLALLLGGMCLLAGRRRGPAASPSGRR
jgi:hypothetical protein